MTDEGTRNLQEWDWNNAHWQLSDTRKFNLPEQSSKIAITSGVTSQGNLYALFQFESLQGKNIQSNLLNVSRSLEIKEAAQPFSVAIATPATVSSSAATPVVQSIPTTSAAIVNFEDTQAPARKKIVGVLLVVAVVALLVFLIVPKRRTTQSKQSK
jgi:hypothetical protein